MIDETLETSNKVRELQIKLYRKAKNEPGFRFHLLYDKIYRIDGLRRAWTMAKANDGAPGVDGQTFEQIESQGVRECLNRLQKSAREDLSSIAGEAGDDRKGRRRGTATAYPDDTGQGGADRGKADTGTDL